jgi:hypothetical protein
MRTPSVLLLALGLALCAPVALAQDCTTSWASPVDGNWSDGSNWTAGAPTSSSVACITVSGTYTVTAGPYNPSEASVSSLVLGGETGTQTLASSLELSVSGDAHVRPNGRLELVNRTPGGADGLYLPNGTMLVEGEVVVPGGVSVLTTGGTLDLAPGGTLRLVNDGSTGARVGSPAATFAIRGLLEADCASATCQINAPLDLDGGTVAIATGRLDVRAGGTLRDLALEATEGTSLYFNDVADASITGYVLEGTVSGEPVGDVYWGQTEVAAGPADATLALGGTGFQLVGVGGSFLTSAGGEFLNTGLLTRPNSTSNFSGIDGVTVRNEGRIEIRNGLTLRNGAEIRNEVGGVIAFTGNGNFGSTGDDASLVSRGLIVVEPSATGTSSIQVPADIADAEIRVEAARLDILRGGSLRDTELVVAEGATLYVLGSGDERLWTLDGTLSGQIDGSMSWYGSDFAAGPSNPLLDFTGNGLEFSGQFGYATAFTDGGGEVRNLGRIRLDGSSGWGIGSRGATVVNEGRIELTFPFRFWEDGLLRNEPGGVVQMANGGFMDTDDAGIFENHGLILREGNATSLGFGGTLRSQPGSEIRALTGRVDLDPPAENSFPEGTLLTGTSEVRFIPDFIAEGTISPGTDDEPLATLEFVSSFKLGSTARLVMDVDVDGQSDRIVPASGQTSTLLGGTLVVRLRPGYVPAPGDEFVILLRSANPYDILGEFESIEVEGEVPEGVGFVTEKPNPGVVLLRAVSGVTIEALAGGTSEDGAPVRFVITSAQPVPVGETLDVPLAFEGTATRYLDYVVDITGSTARIPAGETETTVTLFPLRDDLDEGTETVTLRVLPGGDADPGDPDTATITLDDGPPTTETAVGGIAPSRGGNNGTVTASVFGYGFSAGAAVSLQRGGTAIEGTHLSIREDGTGLTARFDLGGAPLGSYHVVVDAGEGTGTLTDGFTVEESNDVFVWADITGTPNPRLNRWSTYTVTVGNAGNTDVFDTLLLLRLTDGIEYEVSGPMMFDLQHPDVDLPEAAAYTGMAVESATVVPLYVYKIGAGQTADITVRIRPSAPIGIGDGAGVSVELYPPNPEAAFSWTGRTEDFNADLAAGTITNWALYHGAIAWAVEELSEDPLGARADALSKAFGADLNNTWNTDAYNYAVNYQTFINAYPTEPAATFTERLNLIAAFPAQAAITLFLNPVGIVVGSVVAIAILGSPLAVVAAVGVARLGLGVLTTLTNWIVSNAGGAVGGSVDPNDKLGPAGQTDLRYVTTAAPARYTIRFENLETASFPAQEVVIVDDLDTDVYDLSTFSLGPIVLPDREVVPPAGARSYQTTVNLAPALPALLVINAALDEQTGRVAWTFTTLDPDTNDLPEDGLIGFLPPNVEPPEGEGSVSFTIEMLPDLPTDTEVANLAEIVFDLNDPIVTPVWSNRIDEDAPTSSVQPIGPSDTWPVTIDVGGSDIGAGILVYRLFVSEGDGPFELYATSTEPVFEFEGEEGATYGFYSIAVDHVLNTENPKDEAEAVFALGVANEEGSALPRALAFDAPYPNPATRTATLRWGLPEAGRVSLRVYDLLGREVARIADGATFDAGWHTTRWEPELASGTYFVRLQAETLRESKALVHRVVIVR